MGTFNKSYDTTVPAGSDAAEDLDVFIKDDKSATNERYELEHNALDSAEAGADDPDNPQAQGRHVPGLVGVLFYGLHADLVAKAGTGGQIGYATDAPHTGFYHYIEDSGWTSLALSTDEYVADNLTLQIVAGSPNILEMRHENQQWTTTYALTDGANIATDCDNSNSFKVTLGANRTLDNPTNMEDGATYVWIISQDAAGSRTMTFGTAFLFPGGAAPVLSTDANAVDIVTAICQGTSLLCSVMYDIK